MNAIKLPTVFISHSSAQKPFVEQLRAKIGSSYTIVDKYSFESAHSLQDEINIAIGKTDFFVLLISDEALNSSWVDYEVRVIRDLVDEDRLQFLPFVIDPSVEITDERIKPWIKKLLLRKYNSPTLVARVIQQKLLQYNTGHNSSLILKQNVFIGRDEDMKAVFRNFFASSENVRSVIISGIPHVGRKFFVEKLLVQLDKTTEFYKPIRISLGELDGMDAFAMQLNEIVNELNKVELVEYIRDDRKCINLIKTLLIVLSSYKENVLVIDDGCIVKANGQIEEWYVDLMKICDESNVLCVVSRYTPKNKQVRNIISHNLHVLDYDSQEIIMSHYASVCQLSLRREDMVSLLPYTNGFPKAIHNVVDIIKQNGLEIAKYQAKNIKQKYDNDLANILKEIQKDELSMQILITLSKFEFITIGFIIDIFGQDAYVVLEKFHNNSLYEVFGDSNQYIRLSPIIADYIKRIKLSLNISIKSSLLKHSKRILQDINDGNEIDLPEFLYNMKQCIVENVHVNLNTVIPSVLLKVIVEEYYKPNDRNVIILGEKFLKNGLGYYDDIRRQIYYWLCCSYCRQGSRKFWNEIDYFRDSPYSYNFLKGFYYRHTKKYENAEIYFQRALDSIATESIGRNYVAKARHEMVIVKMKLGKYSEALALAKNCYEHSPSNTYFIEIYYRCLLRMNNPSKQLLENLLMEMEGSIGKNKKEMLIRMKTEYELYINKNKEKAKSIIFTAKLEKDCDNRFLELLLKDVQTFSM